jgi:hypothetical protein
MPRRIRIIPALLLACAACRPDASAVRAGASASSESSASGSAASSAAAVAQVPAAAVARPNREPAGEPPPAHPAAYLAWVQVDTLPARTVWMDADGREIATRAGMYIAQGGRLWTWETSRKRMVGLDCGAARGGRGLRRRAGSVRTETLRELGSGERHEWLGLPERGDREAGAPPVQYERPLASAGPYLLTGGMIDFDFCGDHATPSRWRAITDLSHLRRDVPLDTAAVMMRDSAAAERHLAATALEYDQVNGPGLEFAGVEVQWTREGTLQGGYRFHRGACFTCGDFGDSYRRSVLIADGELPRWLRAWSRAPEPVRRWWQADPAVRAAWSGVRTWAADSTPEDHRYWFNERTPRAGWSAVDSANAARLLRLFRTP